MCIEYCIMVLKQSRYIVECHIGMIEHVNGSYRKFVRPVAGLLNAENNKKLYTCAERTNNGKD